MTTLIFIIFLCTVVFFKMIIQSMFLLHRLQQMGYESLTFIKWLEGNQYRRILIWNLFELLVPLLLIFILSFTFRNSKITIYKYSVSALMVIVFIWKLIHPFIAGWVGPLAKNKKPLVLTSRVIRLLITLSLEIMIIIFLILLIYVMPFNKFTLSSTEFFRFNVSILLVSVITPITVVFANTINLPFEKLIHFSYFSKARKKLKKSDIKKVGITGSFGKTSTKFFITTILEEKYKTLTTPSSYNTPMGLSKVINQEEDLGGYEYFVAEMGADHTGDIDYLCKLVKPDFGILTAIGVQHLSTFLSVENIIKTKFALLTNLPENGFGIYNYDNDYIRNNIDRFPIKATLYSYSVQDEFFDKVDIYAKNIIHTRKGLEFTVVFKDRRTLDITTELLGKHNAQNLLAAILCAHHLGLSDRQIQEGIKKIQPVEHRLQMINSGSGVLVLDDAFNSNLEGAKEAINVLSEIKGNKKIVVTPGLIELGDEEEKINKEFGSQIGTKVDYAILVGKERTKKIYEGIKETSFAEENIFVVPSLAEAQNVLKGIVGLGDVVLFENDLPDTYDE